MKSREEFEALVKKKIESKKGIAVQNRRAWESVAATVVACLLIFWISYLAVPRLMQNPMGTGEHTDGDSTENDSMQTDTTADSETIRNEDSATVTDHIQAPSSETTKDAVSETILSETSESERPPDEWPDVVSVTVTTSEGEDIRISDADEALRIYELFLELDGESVSRLPDSVSSKTIYTFTLHFDQDGVIETFRICDSYYDYSSLGWQQVTGERPKSVLKQIMEAIGVKEPHRHAYDSVTVIKKATCTTDGKQKKTCSCGDSITETIPGGHVYQDGYCLRGGEADPAYSYSQGLSYSLWEKSRGEMEYQVDGIGTCIDTHIKIPPTYQGIPVTRIASNAFSENANIHTISLSDTAIYIGINAFYGCVNLTEIHWGKGQVEIGINAFSQTSLTRLIIPEQVVSARRSFAFCSLLEDVEVRGGFANGGREVFLECEALKTVTLSGNMTEWDSMFKGCTALETVVVGSGITTISSYAFSGCTSLTKLEFSEGLLEIGASAFENCTGLTEIVFPDSLQYVGGFDYCTNLKTIRFGSGLEEFRVGAFQSCEALEEVVIPEGVRSITKDAFRMCKGLKTLVLADSVEKIGDSAFYGCVNLTDIHWGTGLTSILDGAFTNCTFTEMTFPEGLQRIGDNAFWNCQALTSITLPATLEYCSGFNGCTGLTAVEIPASVTTIGDSAFEECTGLTAVEIPASVTTIGNKAFSGCSQLTSVVLHEGITTIECDAFSQCFALSEIVLPESLKTLESGVFQGCRALTTITLPIGVTKISESVFVGCPELTTVTVLGDVETIGRRAFRNCAKLESIYLLQMTTREVILTYDSDAFSSHWLNGSEKTVVYCQDGQWTYEELRAYYPR